MNVALPGPFVLKRYSLLGHLRLQTRSLYYEFLNHRFVKLLKNMFLCIQNNLHVKSMGVAGGFREGDTMSMCSGPHDMVANPKDEDLQWGFSTGTFKSSHAALICISITI